eukprot:gb/GFBE01081948.1/.p1 GENE.gb/GFBE01081948.1/~~gb/GFBE01081948.1/.p1  ORF type:complete len:215 (+),score=25.04 gb/GFBE01081948.1/:1-645(+)
MGNLTCCHKPGLTPVKLQIYDIFKNRGFRQMNRMFRALGTGAFHAGVEVHGTEYSFGYNTDDKTGIFFNPPMSCQGAAFRETIFIGYTSLSESEALELLKELAKRWRGSDYDLLRCNCCHFSNELCEQLGVGSIPSWVTNLAGAGASINDGFNTLAKGAKDSAIIAAAKAGKVSDRVRSGVVEARATYLVDPDSGQLQRSARRSCSMIPCMRRF